VRAEATFRKSAGAKEQKEELVLVAAAPIEPGEVTIHLAYSAPLSEKLRGIYRVKEGDDHFVFTQFEPSDARRLLPCFDDPIYKVPFDVSVTAPKGNEVFANTKEVKRTDTADGTGVRFDFATSEPMPAYLLALAIGKLEVRDGPTSPVPIRLITVPGKTRFGDLALRAADEQLQLLTKFFDRGYPYDKLDLVAVPNFAAGAMENAGLITFREELLLVDEKTGSAKAKRDLAMVMAHELAHQWFGNLVTMKWWDDLWLNEGFASYLEVLVVDEWKPDMAADLELLGLTGWVMGFDALRTARAVRQPVTNTYEAEEAFDGITYIKGAAILAMLRSWLGPADFEAGVREYIKRHAWSNASADDVFTALSDVSKKNVGAVASTFVNKAGVPLVTAKLVCEQGKPPRVDLEQRRYHPIKQTTADDVLWHIPVCFSYGGATRRGKSAAPKVCTLLSERSSSVPLESKTCPTWLNPNHELEGYYRYALPRAQLTALAKRLPMLSVRERVGFWSNAWALVQAGELEVPTLLEQLRANRRETNREVIEVRIAILRNIADALIEPRSRAGFVAFALKQLLPTAKRIGWDNRASDNAEQRLLRRSVLGALATLGSDPWLEREALERANKYLANPASVAADTATVALRVAARTGKLSVERLQSLAAAAKTPAQRIAAVNALASVPADKLETVLAMMKDGSIRTQDFVYVLRAAVEWADSRAVLLDWLEANIATLADEVPLFGVGRMASTVRRSCNVERWASYKRAFEPVVMRLGAERRLNEALEMVELCVDLRGRQAKATAAYFGK